MTRLGSFPHRPARRRRSGAVALATLLLLPVAGCTAGRSGEAAPATVGASTSAGSPSATTPAGLTTGSSGGTSAPAAPPPTSSSRSTTTIPTPPTRTPTPTPTPTTTTTEPTTPRPPSTGTCVAGSCYRVGAIHELPAGVAPESSGIAASAKVPGAFFVVDDGTGTSDIVAVRTDGSLLARIAVAGMSARNAEALAAGPCGDRAGRCLYVGDIGDNNARRKSITVFRVDEPALSPPPRAPLAADTWRYTYPDGPHNAESLMVEPDGSLLVLTKSAPDPTSGKVPPHRIYRAPAGGGVLTSVSSFRPPEPAAPAQSLFTGTVVTDASYTAGRVLLLTYDEVVEYRAPTLGADPATFPSWPHAELPAPAMIQSEGITATRTGCGYEVTSEEGPDGSRAGLAAVSCG